MNFVPSIRVARDALCATWLVATSVVPLAASARPPVSEMTHYTTRANDTLYGIAQRYLQSPQDWRRLARVNHVSATRRLRTGVELKVPVARLRRESLSARVLAVQGAAERVAGGFVVPLVVGMSLNEGDRVRTADTGFVTLELPDGTLVSMLSDSDLRLTTLRRTCLTNTIERAFSLERGSLDSEVKHLKHRDDRFEIHAPSVTAGVRGTQFRTHADAGDAATRIEVLDGAVTVASDPDSQPTLVPAHYGLIAGAAGEIGEAVELLPAPSLIKPERVQDEPDVTFDLAPLAGARQYHVQLARDAGALDLFRQTRTETSRATFGEVPDGTYFVRITALDANGLEGEPRIYAFERRQMGLAASATPQAKGYVFRWTPTGADTHTRYRFVLSSSPDLHAPIIDEEGLSGREIMVSNLTAGDYYWAVEMEVFEAGRFYDKMSPIRALTLPR
ncbi:FecR domain-containing protein [Burkholderia vietnamiensis]|uniref:FecR domain-containing protein n=1 Tax=Burkholderia vietnamiensis TaxID=60552 RepID=UPI0007558A3B|nr:peptidase M23 [Burkholderia vietnamiensis]KVF41708.1 peptidase M23 [Burkholderia vietnamiensis]MBR8036274.1 FecR domain-containing protein [Burkholderia vietnamiensis]